MKKPAILTAAALALSGCGLQPGTYSSTPVSAREAAIIKATITPNLKDEQSARWRNIRTITTRDGKSYVCGELNATNSFGGYTGYLPFYGRWNADGTFMVQGVAQPDTAYAYFGVCPA